jgi:hypothetical protein
MRPKKITREYLYRRLVKPGGWIVLEDPDMASWCVNPDATAVQRSVDLIKEGFRAARVAISTPVVNFHPSWEPRGRTELDAHVVALSPGHPYLRLPLQFATSLAATARSACCKG